MTPDAPVLPSNPFVSWQEMAPPSRSAILPLSHERPPGLMRHLVLVHSHITYLAPRGIVDRERLAPGEVALAGCRTRSFASYALEMEPQFHRILDSLPRLYHEQVELLD